MAKASRIARYAAEFVGTFLLVLTVSAVTYGKSVLGPLAVGTALMIAIYAMGSVSGAHFNPAVTVGVAVTGGHTGFGCVHLAPYIFAQLLGAVAAAFLGASIWMTTMGGASTPVWSVVGNVKEAGGVWVGGASTFPASLGNLEEAKGGLWSACLAELIYTAVLVFVVINVATFGKNDYFGFAIGNVVTAAACAIGSISGCCLNPAVTLGVSLLELSFGSKEALAVLRALLMFFLYAAAQCFGSLFACGFIQIVRKAWLDIEKAGTAQWEVPKPSMLSKLVSEFCGTFVLCLTVELVVHAPASPIACVGIAASLAVMIYALGDVSGANFNPAVSFGLLCAGALEVVSFAAYLGIQLLAAFTASLTSYTLLRNITTVIVSDSQEVAGAAKGSWVAIALAELVFTFMLVYTVLNVAVRDAPNNYFGMAIGFVVIVGASSVGSISGGCFNPAVAFTLYVTGGIFTTVKGNFLHWLFYLFIELLGGALAAGVYKLVSMTTEYDSDDEWEYEDGYE